MNINRKPLKSVNKKKQAKSNLSGDNLKKHNSPELNLNSNKVQTPCTPTHSSIHADTVNSFNFKRMLKATLAAMPLSLSVVPWAVLCGTLSIEAGMTSFQAQLMSLIVFAGAAQISGISIMGAGGSWLNLFNSTAMISVRHVLYSAAYKKEVLEQPFFKRVLFAFLLTDEMFVLAQSEQIKTGNFDYWYAITVGFVFYLFWNIATFIGILSANLFSDIENLGFDFAIAATFIAMVMPMVKDKALALAVLISAISSLVFEYLHITNGLMFSALIGMAIGAMLYKDNAK